MMSAILTKAFIKGHLESIVGAGNVSTDPKVLERYSRDQSFVTPRAPLCVVKPRNVEEVQAIVKFTSRYKIPLVPYSMGKNNQGAAIPSIAGATIIDLSRMNRVIAIDTKPRLALIEPGVTFTQLQDEAKKIKTDEWPLGLRVCTPLELPASASVLVTYLELAPLYSWPRYETEFLMTSHVVLGDGDIFKTGEAAVVGESKPYEPGYGVWPVLDKAILQAQGTLGIVVQGWVKLKTRHEVNRVLFIRFDKIEDIFVPLREIRFVSQPATPPGEELFIMNKMDLALLLAERVPEEFENIREVLPPWTLVHILRGPREQVDYHTEDLQDVAKRLGIKIQEELPGVERAGDRILGEMEYPKGWEKTSKYKGARSTIPFITLTKRIPDYNRVVEGLAEKYGYPKDDIGCTLLPVEIGRVHYQYGFHRSPEDTETVRELFMEASKRLLDMVPPPFFSRPYPLWADMVYGRCPSYYRLVKIAKTIMDPDNIMNPGKLML